MAISTNPKPTSLKAINSHDVAFYVVNIDRVLLSELGETYNVIVCRMTRFRFAIYLETDYNSYRKKNYSTLLTKSNLLY